MAAQLVHLLRDGSSERHPLGASAFRIGRDPSADLALDSARVSRQHARIEREGAGHVLVDLGAPNGTTLNGQPLRGRAPLEDGDLIGVAGEATLRFERTRESRRGLRAALAAALALALLASATTIVLLRRRALERRVYAPAVALVEEGLLAREHDPAGAKARFKSAVGVLYRSGLLDDVGRATVFDEGLRRIEPHLAHPIDLRAVFRSLEDATEVKALSDRPPCRLDRSAASELATCLRAGIGWLLAELHQSDTDVPDTFVRQVGATLIAEHDFLTRALPRRQPIEAMMRSELEGKRMPGLLHYVAGIESGYRLDALSQAGAVGLWQFMPRTAADFGLRVGDGVDERKDAAKSSAAAAQYLQHLVFEFGSDSLLLSLAGYNYGQERVRSALKKLDDPFHDRSYWRLVERGLLPPETAAYVARFAAAALAGEAGLPDEDALRAAGY